MATDSTTTPDVEAGGAPKGAIVLLARFMFASIFLLAAPDHFSKHTIAYAAAQGLPLASVAVPLSGIIALAGGLSIFFGYRTKFGSWLIVLFLVPVTVVMHKFWGSDGPKDRPGADDHVYEERVDARRSIVHFTVRSGTVQSRRPTLALNAATDMSDGIQGFVMTGAFAIYSATLGGANQSWGVQHERSSCGWKQLVVVQHC